MTLRTRLLWLFLPLLAFNLLGIWLLSERILLERFDRDDRQRLYDEVRVLSNRLGFEKKRHLDILRSYAWWDASYRFVARPDPHFVAENLDIDMLGNLDFDFVLYLDRQGKVVTQRWDQARLASIAPLNQPPPAEKLRDDLLATALRLGVLDIQGDASRSLAQWLLLDGYPLLLLSQPISDNTGLAPPVGALVAGYLLGPQRLQALQEQMDASLRLQPRLDPGEDWRTLQVPGRNGGALLSPRRVLDKNTQQASLLFLDGAGQPQFRLDIGKSRQAFQQGREATRAFLGMTLLLTLGAMLLAYVALEVWVIRRVQRLNHEVANIGAASGPARLSEMGRDEVGQMASEVNQMLVRLEQSEARDRAILETIRDGYFEMDGDGVVLTVNAAFCRLLGYGADEVVGYSYRQLLDEQDVTRARSLYQQVRNDEHETTFAAPFKRRDGQRVTFETRVSPIIDASGEFRGFRGILRDISLQVAYQQRLLDLAYRDALTGLGNRKAFNEQLPEALQRCAGGASVALLYVDLDHFKPVNDRFGHAAGDAVLAQVGERLRSNLRQPDLAFRLGGDEFAVVLEAVDSGTAESLARRLLASLNEDYHAAGQRLEFLSASIGIALYPTDAGDAEGLIQAADSAMYHAKQQRNQFSRYRA
ncbi:sensor domain-containing diguanylate cyclase [Pseudomonas citronellolis]|uniref:sensor domain-containing diguanylate cyclase n=1 Tax=Pseudomonas citronellolis TaxID=53408 RepID=UPI0023E441C6|nr:diguanylate cyclase [Pseudomonas citronellolis]MDF3936600.1 diguanylate cyclase [Pseudomonas citronellolis]